MSTLALEPSSRPEGSRIAVAARYADLVLLAVAMPVFLLAGLPMAAYAAVGAAWLIQRAVQYLAESRMASAARRETALRLIAVSFMARLFVLTVAILLVGILADDETGLSAAVLAAALVTANLAGEAMGRLTAPPEEPR